MSQSTSNSANPNPSLPPLPADHLDHPSEWATGLDPATGKQKGFIKVLEGQHANLVPEGGIDVGGMGKSEASEVIDKLKSGKEVVGGDARPGEGVATHESHSRENGGGGSAKQEAEKEDETQGGMKRKDPPADPSAVTHADDEASQVPSRIKKLIKEQTDLEGATDKTAEKEKSSHQADQPESSSARANKKARVEDADEDDKPKRRAVEAKLPKVADDNIEKVKDVPPRPANPIPNDRPDEKIEADDEKASEANLEQTIKQHENPKSANRTGASAASTDGASASTNGTNGDTVPGDGIHLDHPENWATGDQPATSKQKGFLHVLEKQSGEDAGNIESMGKSEASEKIDELKK